MSGQPLPVGDWTFDPATNAIVFAAGKVPGPGDRITVRYRSVCGAPVPGQ